MTDLLLDEPTLNVSTVRQMANLKDKKMLVWKVHSKDFKRIEKHDGRMNEQRFNEDLYMFHVPRTTNVFAYSCSTIFVSLCVYAINKEMWRNGTTVLARNFMEQYNLLSSRALHFVFNLIEVLHFRNFHSVIFELGGFILFFSFPALVFISFAIALKTKHLTNNCKSWAHSFVLDACIIFSEWMTIWRKHHPVYPLKFVIFINRWYSNMSFQRVYLNA